MGKPDEITPEQRERGRRGEEELKRRLALPNGWEGFILIEDKRFARCGYDFLCSLSDHNAKLEVKTFTKNGRVFMTIDELKEATASQNDYYLIGILDDGEKPVGQWDTFVIKNPIVTLMAKGEFELSTRIWILSSDIFHLGG